MSRVLWCPCPLSNPNEGLLPMSNVPCRPESFPNTCLNTASFLPTSPVVGTDSPQAVRKLMALSDPSKTGDTSPSTRCPVSSPWDPPGTPTPRSGKRVRLERTKGSARGDPTGSTKLSLTAEDSSVTSLPALRKAANSVDRRRHQPKHSVFQSPVPGIPGNSPPSLRKAGAARAHERFGSGDPTGSTKLSLTAEDSSVTSLPALRKAANSV
ncbi:hypothetical protein TCAL_15416, partial [Tigriopus californicus]